MVYLITAEGRSFPCVSNIARDSSRLNKALDEIATTSFCFLIIQSIGAKDQVNNNIPKQEFDERI